MVTVPREGKLLRIFIGEDVSGERGPCAGRLMHGR